MRFSLLNRREEFFSTNDVLNLHKTYITANHSHVNDVCDMIIDAANYIKLESDDKFNDFYDLVSLFNCGRKDLLMDVWIGGWNTTLSDEEKLNKIYEKLFTFIGFQTGDDVEYEYDDDIIWKIQDRFPSIRKENFDYNRLNYVIATAGKRFNVMPEKVTSIFCYDMEDYVKKDSSFKLSHHFTINENERRLYCKSEITFYSPENIEVTRQFTVFYNCSCSMMSRYNYTKEENLEIDKWMLRKISFLRFLEVVNQYRKDRSWHPDSYIDTYWFNIYTDRKRNRIKLG